MHSLPAGNLPLRWRMPADSANPWGEFASTGLVRVCVRLFGRMSAFRQISLRSDHTHRAVDCSHNRFAHGFGALIAHA
eukprot:4653378-Prymnesium_polylepis.1